MHERELGRWTYSHDILSGGIGDGAGGDRPAQNTTSECTGAPEAARQSPSAPPQPHIERTSAAMADAGAFETDDITAQIGALEPQRDLALQHPALRIRISARPSALAGDHQHDARPVPLGAAQEVRERRMRVSLRHAMEVDAVVDRLGAAGQLGTHA